MPALAAIAAAQPSLGAGGRSPFSSASDGAATDERLYAFEAAGLLLCQDQVDPEAQARMLHALLLPLIAQIDSAVAAVPFQPGGPRRAVQPPEMVATLAQAVNAICHVAKGFTRHVASVTRPQARGPPQSTSLPRARDTSLVPFLSARL